MHVCETPRTDGGSLMFAFLSALFCSNAKDATDSHVAPKIEYSREGKVSVSAHAVITSHTFKEQMRKTDEFFQSLK